MVGVYKRRSGRWVKETPLKNPFFLRGRRAYAGHRALSGRGFLTFFSILAVTFGWFYLFFASPYFKITRIDVRGDNVDLEGAIRNTVAEIMGERRWFFLSQMNIYLLSKKETEKRLAEQFLLQKIEIKKEYPNALSVDFKTKRPALTMVSKERQFTLDIAGSVIEKKNYEEDASSTFKNTSFDPNLPVLLNKAAQDFAISAIALENQHVQFIKTIFENVPLKSGIKINFFSFLADSPSSLSLRTAEGWDILFNLHTDPMEQIDKLAVVLKEQNPEERQKLNYIDLRFGDRIFYK